MIGLLQNCRCHTLMGTRLTRRRRRGFSTFKWMAVLFITGFLVEVLGFTNLLSGGLPGTYLFSGARPSSGAAASNAGGISEKSSALEQAELAAPEDGRAPLKTSYYARGYCLPPLRWLT